MATGKFILYTSALQDFADGTQDWDSDNHYGILLTNAYTPALSHSVLSDVSGSEGSIPRGDFSGEAVFTFNDVSYCTASTTTFSNNATGTVKYLVIVKGTKAGSLPSDPLVGYMDLNVGGDITVSGEVFDIGWDPDLGIFALGNGEERFTRLRTTTWGLTNQQFYDTDLFLAIRAHESQVVKRNTSNDDDVTGSPEVVIADGDILDRVYDAGPYDWHVRQQTASNNDPEWDTDAVGFENGSILWNSTGPGFEVKRSRYSADFLSNDTTSFTIIWRGSINEGLSSPKMLIGTYVGPNLGFVLNYGINSGADDIGFGVHDGVSTFDGVFLTTWSGFTQGQVYTIVIRHTVEDITEIYIDDLDTPVASGLISTWTNGLPNDNIWISERPSGSQDAQVNLQGIVICKKYLSNAEVEGYVNWMRGNDPVYDGHTFTTLTELYDAVDAGFEGNWRIKWEGDPYVADGELLGRVENGQFIQSPFMQGVEFPSWLIETSDWTGGVGQTITPDSDGRPIFQNTTVPIPTEYWKLDPTRYGFRRFTEISSKVEVDLAGVDSADNRWGFRFRNVDDPTNDYIQVYHRDQTGDTITFQVVDGGVLQQQFQSGLTEADPWTGTHSIWVEDHNYADTPNFKVIGQPLHTNNTNILQESNGHSGWSDDTGYDYEWSILFTSNTTAPTYKLLSLNFNGGMPEPRHYNITDWADAPLFGSAGDTMTYTDINLNKAEFYSDGGGWILRTTYGDKVQFPFAQGGSYFSAPLNDLTRTEDYLTVSGSSIIVGVPTTNARFEVEPVFDVNHGVLGVYADANGSNTQNSSFSFVMAGVSEVRNSTFPQYGVVSKLEIAVGGYSVTNQYWTNTFGGTLAIHSSSATTECELNARWRDAMVDQDVTTWDMDTYYKEVVNGSDLAYNTALVTQNVGPPEYWIGVGQAGTGGATCEFQLHYWYIVKR